MGEGINIDRATSNEACKKKCSKNRVSGYRVRVRG